MTFVCLSSPTWPTAAASSTDLAARALGVAPRVRLEPGLLWADARGLDARGIAGRLVTLLESAGVERPRAGVATTPIAALVAARIGEERITVVPPGFDRDFLRPLDVGVLHPPPPPNLFPLLAAIGIECCGDLARLDQDTVEVRFGSEGVRLWRLARAFDPRPIFSPRPPDLPNAELEWVDYELANQEQVVFIVNSLLASVTDALAARREGAHAMTLAFSLADRTVASHPIRCSNPTADRKTWLRVIRAALETVTFAAPVVKIALAVEAATPLVDRQGSLFDRGFATARVTEAALAHLLDQQADAIVTARRDRHPLPEARIAWIADPTGQVSDQCAPPPPGSAAPCLTLQVVVPPRSVDVWTAARRGRTVPLRYFDGTRNHSLSVSLGPDRASGGFGEDRFDREYFQGIRSDGMPVLLYHDLAADRWFLAGWWD
jgi:hypothetical protein